MPAEHADYECPPFLFVGSCLSGVYIATRYRRLDQDPRDPREPGCEVLEKVEVTERFETIARNLGWTPPLRTGRDERTEGQQ